jgi:hypothetical protein
MLSRRSSLVEHHFIFFPLRAITISTISRTDME